MKFCLTTLYIVDSEIIFSLPASTPTHIHPHPPKPWSWDGFKHVKLQTNAQAVSQPHGKLSALPWKDSINRVRGECMTVSGQKKHAKKLHNLNNK